MTKKEILETLYGGLPIEKIEEMAAAAAIYDKEAALRRAAEKAAEPQVITIL